MTHTESWSVNITSWRWSIQTANESQHLEADRDRLFSPHYIRAAANNNVHYGLVWHNESVNIIYYSPSLWKVKDSKKIIYEYCVYVLLYWLQVAKKSIKYVSSKYVSGKRSSSQENILIQTKHVQTNIPCNHTHSMRQ